MNRKPVATREQITMRTRIAIALLAAAPCLLAQEPPSAPAPFPPVPNPTQLRWQRAEMIMLAHFGLYVSIIDMHFEVAGSPRHATYGDYYFDQIKELSTSYGPVDEHWFDGFNADKLRMDYPKIGRMIAETRPDAVVYDSGMLVKTLPQPCIAWPGAHGGIKPDQNYLKEVDGVTRWSSV